jgi:hypothetical protein
MPRSKCLQTWENSRSKTSVWRLFISECGTELALMNGGN